MFLRTLAQIQNCPEGDSGACLTNLPQVTAGGSAVQSLLSVVFAVISAIAVIIIIIQAIKFTLTSGEPEKAANARKGIIYAVVGLAVSLSANAIILFVLQDVFA